MNQILKPGTCVKYTGAAKALLSLNTPGFSVENTVHHGEPIGNGETNRSKQDVVVCRSLFSGVRFIFLRSEVAPA